MSGSTGMSAVNTDRKSLSLSSVSTSSLSAVSTGAGGIASHTGSARGASTCCGSAGEPAGAAAAARLWTSVARVRRAETSPANATGSAPTGTAAFFFLPKPNADFLDGALSLVVQNCGIDTVCTCDAPSSDRSRAMIVSSSLGERNGLTRMRSGTWRAMASTARAAESTITSSAWMVRATSRSTFACA